MPVLIFSVAVLALPAAPPVPVLMTVPVEGSLTRRMVRLWMVAATLFSVITRGRLITLALPWSSRAVKRAASACTPSSEPSTRSSVELADELRRVVDAVRDVAHDDGVGAVVEGDAAAVGEHALHLLDERLVGLGVVDADVADAQRLELARGLFRGAQRLALLLQPGD